MKSAGVETGIFELSWEEYDRIKALNCSTLLWGHVSMLHLKWALEGRLRREDTLALAFGRALHMKLLEPDRFDSLYCVMPEFGDQRNTGNKERKVAWMSENAGKEFLERLDAAAIANAVIAVKKHPAEWLRKFPGKFEVAAVADLIGERCKGRLDKWIEKPSTIVDIKKVGAPDSPSQRSGSARSFANRIPGSSGYGYGMQAAMYVDLIKKLTGENSRYYWIVVEDAPPFAVGVYQASAELLDAGRNEYGNLLSRLKMAREDDKWPGYTEEAEELYGPEWWHRQYNGL